MKSIDPHELLAYLDGNSLIDVRSPQEYAAGHIPGAINIPLFSDEERKVVGTLYKQNGRKPAMLKALDFVGPKLADIVKKGSKLPIRNHLIVHCWRGGMRSAGVSWLLNIADIPTVTIRNGYKGFRNHILDFFAQPLDIRIITACTGSGKTELLRYMQENGHQVVDLERIAHHKGSAFGSLGQGAQPTSEQFQNDLFWAMKGLNPKLPVWMEDESLNIGTVAIPDPLWRQMRTSKLIRVDLSLETRIERLVKEYAIFEKNLLASSILKISKRLGGQNLKLALDELDSGNFHELTKILLYYYDKAYNKTITERQNQIVFEKVFDNFDPKTITEEILSKIS